MKRSIATCLLATLLVTPTVPLSAQEKPEPLPKLMETVNVRVVNVDVVVTDRKGNPVHGLDVSEFEIVENRIQQKITNFYEVADRTKGTTTPKQPARGTSPTAVKQPLPVELPDQQKRKIIFFVDNLSLNPLSRNRVFKSMKEFAAETMRPGDEAMVATWNRSMKIRVPFTPDVIQIQQSLDSILGESSYGAQNMSERRGVESQIREARTYESAIGAARQYAQSVEHDLRQTVSAVTGLLSTLAGVEGKKVMVMTSEGFPMQPGREMFQYIDDLKREKQDWQGSGSSLLEGMSFESSSLISAVARAANANGITIYPIHAGGLVGNNEMSAENNRPVSFQVQQSAVSNSTDSLALMADMTGGVATLGTNNFADGLKRITRDLGSYYSLGYRSSTERVDRQRSVEVKMKNRNYVARSRRTFVEKSVPTEMTDRVVANLFYPTKANDLRITVVTGRPVAFEDKFKVPVEIHIPMESLTLIPQGETLAGGFSIFLGVADKNGDMSDVTQRNQPLRFSPLELEKMKGKHFTYAVELLMAGGRNKISVGVIDDLSNSTGFERRDILAADLR